jgi:hypothetical protein
MNRHDRKRWASAQTLADLGALMIAWLNGEMRETPGHLGPPCEETISLIPVLIACNRAGFVTIGSQPGKVETCAGGLCEQRAGVEGIADAAALARLREAIKGTGLRLITHRAPRRQWRWSGATHEDAMVVTRDCGEDFTQFGATLSRGLACDMAGARSPEACEAVIAAWQVTIIDPEWGRNSVLWPALERFAAMSAERAA